MAIPTLASVAGPCKHARLCGDVDVIGDDVSYSYKPSLVGEACSFTLTPLGLSWRVRGRSGLWAYADIAAIRLSYRPVSMQARRFRADLKHRDGASLAVISTSWQTVALMAAQDDTYRDFIVALHARMAQAGSTAALTGGLRRWVHRAAVTLLTIVAAMMTMLLVRALLVGQWVGALFLIGFAALFAWQTGGFVWRNTPRTYGFDTLPADLLP